MPQPKTTTTARRRRRRPSQPWRSDRAVPPSVGERGPTCPRCLLFVGDDGHPHITTTMCIQALQVVNARLTHLVGSIRFEAASAAGEAKAALELAQRQQTPLQEHVVRGMFRDQETRLSAHLRSLVSTEIARAFSFWRSAPGPGEFAVGVAPLKPRRWWHRWTRGLNRQPPPSTRV